MKEKSTEPLKNVIKSLGALIKSMFKLAPFIALMLIGTSTYFVFIIAEYTNLYVLFATIIVVFVSLVVHIKSNNFGESALALVAGILAIFSVTWDKNSFIIFSSTWIGFAILVFLVSSLRLAMKLESLRRRAAIRFNASLYKEVEKLLEKSAKNSNLKMLSPIEKAEVQLVFAYSNVDLNIIDQALIFTEQLYVITDIDHHKVALFVSDLLSLIKKNVNIQLFLNSIYKLMNEAPYPPEELFEIIRRTKYIVFQNILSSENYFEKIIYFLSNGIHPDEIKQKLLESK